MNEFGLHEVVLAVMVGGGAVVLLWQLFTDKDLRQ